MDVSKDSTPANETLEPKSLIIPGVMRKEKLFSRGMINNSSRGIRSAPKTYSHHLALLFSPYHPFFCTGHGH
jgi:hypothetical protein